MTLAAVPWVTQAVSHALIQAAGHAMTQAVTDLPALTLAQGPGTTITDGALPLALALAALAGLVSFASPCVLPLVPGYLGYVTGLSGEALADRSRGRLVTGAALFVAGFSAVFIVLTLFVSSAAGLALAQHRVLLTRIGGVIVILLGLVFIGAGARLGTQAEARLHWRPRAGLLGAPLLGGVFALGWSPCLGPTLGAVIIVATATDSPSPARAAVLAAAYCLGLGMPFLLAAVAVERFAPVQRWLGRHRRAVQMFGGLMLILIGLLLVTGLWMSLVTWLQTELSNGFEVPL